MKLVKIDWVDASMVGEGWSELDDVKVYVQNAKCVCSNVGWVLEESKEQIVIVAALQKNSDFDEFNRGAQIFAIPKQWCMSISELIEKPISKKK